MAQRTLLSIVQEILSVMDSDEVNNIFDTIESTQIANVVKEVHDELIIEYDIPKEKELFQLVGLADTSKPSFMKLPSNISTIEFIKYDIREASGDAPKMTELSFVSPAEFLRTVQSRTKSATNIVTSTINNIELFILNDKHPTTWTSFDDTDIVFDSYVATLDVTMQASKSMLFAEKDPDLVLLDATVINLPPKLIPLLLNEAKAMSFAYFKDEPNFKIENKARRARNKAQRNKQLTGYSSQMQYRTYGRS